MFYNSILVFSTIFVCAFSRIKGTGGGSYRAPLHCGQHRLNLSLMTNAIEQDKNTVTEIENDFKNLSDSISDNSSQEITPKMESKIHVLNKRIANLQNTVNQRDAQINTLRGEIGQWNCKLKNKIAENCKLTDKINATIEECHCKTQNITAENCKLKSILKAKTQKLNELSKENEKLKIPLAILSNHLVQVTFALQEAEAAKHLLYHQLQQITKDYNLEKQRIKNLTESIKRLEKENQQLMNQTQNVTLTLSFEITQIIKIIEASNNETNNETNYLQSKINELESKNKALKLINNHLKTSQRKTIINDKNTSNSDSFNKRRNFISIAMLVTFVLLIILSVCIICVQKHEKIKEEIKNSEQSEQEKETSFIAVRTGTIRTSGEIEVKL